MRHRVKKGPKLSRLKSHREAVLRNLLTSLILYEKIKTTKVKGKETKRLIDRLILIGRNQDSLSAKRHLNSFLYDPKATEKIIQVIAKADPERASGFCRLYHLPNRLGDNAPMVQIELILPENLQNLESKKTKEIKVKTKVTQRSAKPKSDEANQKKPGILGNLKIGNRQALPKTKVTTRTTSK